MTPRANCSHHGRGGRGRRVSPSSLPGRGQQKAQGSPVGPSRLHTRVPCLGSLHLSPGPRVWARAGCWWPCNDQRGGHSPSPGPLGWDSNSVLTGTVERIRCFTQVNADRGMATMRGLQGGCMFLPCVILMAHSHCSSENPTDFLSGC